MSNHNPMSPAPMSLLDLLLAVVLGTLAGWATFHLSTLCGLSP